METEIKDADIVSRLEGRVALMKQGRGDDAPCYVEMECAEAAARIAELEAALQKIANMPGTPSDNLYTAINIAAEALEK